jgi:murein L,D-transpeptidase YcbB/YkuD
MIARGWDLGSSPIDVFDRRSDEVLRKFQAEKGLEIDGKIGPNSWDSAWELAVT